MKDLAWMWLLDVNAPKKPIQENKEPATSQFSTLKVQESAPSRKMPSIRPIKTPKRPST